MKDYSSLLKGKKVFVNTAGRGMGRAIALLFAQQGAAVAISARNEDLLQKTVDDLKRINPDCIGIPADMSDLRQINCACDYVIDEYGAIDVLINVVGVNRKCLAHEYKEEDLDLLIDTNLKSMLRCTKKFVPGMLSEGSGSVINVSSIHSELTMPGYTLYALTKGAMDAATRAMALDYASKGIRFNCICPGLIMSDVITDEINSYPEGVKRNEFLDLLEGMQPLPSGKMEDIADAALFLASDMSSYITGQSIFVDGGASIKAHP